MQGEFRVEEVFELKGRGSVLLGQLVSGTLRPGMFALVEGTAVAIRAVEFADNIRERTFRWGLVLAGERSVEQIRALLPMGGLLVFEGVAPEQPNRNALSKRAIVAKGGLFLLLAVLAGVSLVVLGQGLPTLALVLVLAWASARFYYFLFYVLQTYVDPSLQYSGASSMIRWLLRRRL